MKTLLSLILICFTFASCGVLETRSFSGIMVEEDPFFMPNRDFDVVGGDEGRTYRNISEIYGRTPAGERSSYEMNHHLTLEQELINLENAQDNSSYEQYRRYANKLSSTSEKIYFLRLDSNADREDYLRSRGIIDDVDRVYSADSYASRREPLYETPVRQPELGVGAGEQEVIAKWGQPIKRERQGSNIFSQEVWSYRGDNGRIKQLYFSQGQLQGWADYGQ